MAKKVIVDAVKAALSFKSLEDLGYQFAEHCDRDQDYLVYARENIEHFPDAKKIKDEDRDHVKAGFMLRYIETHPAVHYMQDGEDSFKAIETGQNMKDSAGFECSVAYCVNLPKH